MHIDGTTYASALTGLVAGLTSGTVISAVFTFITKSRTAEIENRIKAEFERQNAVLLAQRQWKEAVLAELLGPIYMQLDRTKRAFARYREKNLYLEAKVIRAGNEAIRDRLLAHGHLIPPHLIEDAGRLVEHYDSWLEEFERQRSGQQPGLESRFVFAGPLGYPFPKAADDHFRKACRELAAELAGQNP